MTAVESGDRGTAVPRRVSWARYGYALTAGVFAVCILAQAYIAGMAVFVDPANWAFHASFVHLFEPLLVVLLALAFLGRLSRSLKLAPVGLFLLLGVQYATAHQFGSMVAAIHPANAAVIFAVALAATRRAWSATVEGRSAA